MDKTEKLIDWNENERTDRNRNGLDDQIEPPIPDVAAGSARLAERIREDGAADPVVTGGDLDANWANAQFSGDDAVISSAPAPAQGAVDDLGKAMGVTYQDNEELRVGEKERDRDRKRFELDPASSDDWAERNRDESR